MKEYKFYGWQDAEVSPVADKYSSISNPRHLYDLLSEIWCRATCAPRMQEDWTEENMTLGQCSITAFLAQDIFGGKVYGILRPDGSYHCYNVVGDCVFDLTSEQFTHGRPHKTDSACDENEQGEQLCYVNNPEQFKEVHFAKEEKRLRYEFLKSELEKKLEK